MRAYLEQVWGDAARALQAAAPNNLMEPLELEFTVACPPERAFALWARADLAAGGRTGTRCPASPA